MHRRLQRAPMIIQLRGINDPRFARIVLIKPLRIVDKSISRREIFPAKRIARLSRAHPIIPDHPTDETTL